MFIGEGDELDPLVPEELGEDIQGLVDMGSAEGERAAPRLRPRPVRQLRPDDAVSHAVGANALLRPDELAVPVDDFPHLVRPRELREFEGGIGAF